MLRWRLSTVRAPIGGHDANPRLPRFFNPPTLPLCRLIRAHANPVAALVEKPVVASSSAQLHPQYLPANPLGGRNPCRAARSRTSYSAIDTLREWLSSENLASGRPLTYSPAAIRSLYYRAESRNQLGMLDSRMFTILMGLFGSLSIDPCISAVYRDPLASRLLEVSRRRTHWAFVLKVGRYKLERRMTLQDSDRFWMMCAELAFVQARPPLEPLSGDAYSAILRARTHYHIIRRHSRRPELHACYLETLLAIRDPRLLHFVACDLSFLLRNHRVCHPRLQRLLYRLVIKHGEFLSTRSQEAILAALWSRACQRSGGTLDLVPKNGLSDIALDGCILDTTTIARSLSTTLFASVDHLPNDKSANSFDQLFSVFSAAYTLPLRWSSLILFSIVNSSEMLHSNGTHWMSNHAMPPVISCWNVIFGLAFVEKMSQDRSKALAMQPTPTEGVLETTRTLYQLWLPIIKPCLVSRDLACAVATSFLRIASVLADKNLFYDCQDLYHLEHSAEGPRTLGQQLLAAQYIAAAVRVQGPHPDVVLTALEAFSPDLKQQHRVLTSAVEALSPTDASLAYTLYTVAQGMGMELDPRAAYALAISLTQRGAFDQAIHFLNNGQFSLEKRGILVSAIARCLRESPRTRHPPAAFVTIVDELAALYHSHVPPEHFRGHLEQLFIVLAQHGRGSQLFPVILSIFKRLPNFFQPRFFVRYCHVLMRRRQFSTAGKLLSATAAVHPTIARSLRILTGRIVMQTKAFRVCKRIIRGPTSLRLSSRLRRRPYAVPPLGISLQELLKSGRVLAAKHIFTCAAATIPSRRCTTLGNILLHGVSRQPTSRNRRRVHKVLALLENLDKNHGFRPDRVTANILIKVMINWRSAFDSPRLRELFDELVRGGYPAADYSPLDPPFHTRRTQLTGSSGFSKLPAFVSFKKHTRPLFKMFIRAFYLCNDVEAARKVVGILKVEECKNAVAKEVRQRARSRGRVKAGQSNVIPLDGTVSSID
ncbi:hypothetical protein OG21DRAFT_1495746 [Imleria badia]|nr:hypothetical protein OG21DRAFT_1495746 [Imleria badia]